MAVRKEAVKNQMDSDSRKLSKTEPTGIMRTYQMKFPTQMMEPFRAYCKDKGLSLAAGSRLAVAEYMEKLGLR